MPSYPVSKINTPDAQVNILQITDLHLSTPIDFMTASESMNSNEPTSCQHSFEKALQQALDKDIRCDLILVTGDLVNQIQPAIYNHIFEVLEATEVPFACIAGNHDVTDEVDGHLPFEQRKLIGRPADARLLSQHVIETDHWQLLLLDSSVTGKVAGEVTPADIDWLLNRLTTCDKPALVALHHHVLPVDSAWIDSHMVENSADFWQCVARFEQLKVVTSGHVHQEQTQQHRGVSVYSTPSTCYQFMPNEDGFAYDKDTAPGYRWLQLANNGKVASWIERLDT
ncbi:metallophosphoesterase [Psychrobacter sp.]|uniref:metallophosphoesterase n=1 Tax=Psychrobacter sp. TaxID=56811 RepID=UPI003F95B381